jgi:signal transduction histidine kinase
VNELAVNELALPDLFEAAARATIIERCAPAYLHDVRGSMQALFSALELLGRSAKAGGNPLRVEKVCDLARRAISNHEKSTMAVLQLLTLQHVEAAAVDVGALMSEVAHFLRNDAAAKQVTISICGTAKLYISAESTRLQTLLVGLVTAALDNVPAGTELKLSIDRRENDAVISIGSDAGYGEIQGIEELWQRPQGRLRPRELTLLFARQFLAANGGRLEINPDSAPGGALHLYYPCMSPD